MKIVQIGLVILLMHMSSAAGFSAELVSRLEDDDFYNRIRIETDDLRISLSALYSGGELGWIEPALKSAPVSAGRLEPAGIIRECLNPDSCSPGATVLSEKGRLAVTDSFGRSSRYGIAVRPAGSDELLLWGWQTNGGLYQTGVLFQEFEPAALLLPPGSMKFETDFMLTVSETEADSPSSWFSDQPVLPSQLLLNPAFECRFRCGESGKKGRALLTPSADIFSVAGSLLGAFSLPVYTEFGWFYRCFIAAGSREINLECMLQESSPGYIAFSGRFPGYSHIAGIGLNFLLGFNWIEISGSLSYTGRIENETVIPSRIIPQSDILDGKVSFGMLEVLNISFNAELCREFENNGNQDFSSSAGIDATVSTSEFEFGCGTDFELYDAAGNFSINQAVFNINTSAELDPLHLDMEITFSGDSPELTAGGRLYLEECSLKSSVTLEPDGLAGLIIEVTLK